MERTEPSLVPEWLKGVGSGSSAHHQDDGQRQRLSQHSEQESPRYSAYVPPRRITIPERHQVDKDSYTGSRVYPNFSRTPSSYRGDHHRGDWDSDRERERDRERAATSFLSDGKDRDDRANGRWPGPGRLLDQEFPLRRPHSVGNSGRLAENGEKRFVSDSSSSSSSKLAGPVPKAAFERHFPSLGAQEKVYSSLGNVSVLSPRHLWQHSRTGVGLDSDSRSSLVEPNGVAPSATSGTPKMAEALAHNPPRVRTPPQQSTETRLEELALKQSRQLVPMIPKTALNSRDKAKPKLTSLVSPSTPKIAQAPSSPMLRQPPPIRVETPKTPQSKLHVLKPGVAIPETAPAASSVGRTPTAGANSTAPRKLKQLLDRRAVPIPPLSASAGGADASRARNSKENGVTEDKRLQAQAQNRSDFYNAIRRKAAGAGGSSSKPEEKSSSGDSNGGGGGAGNGRDRELEDETQDGGESPPVAEVDHRRHHPAPTAYLDNDDNAANGVKSEHSIKDVVGGSEEEEAAFLRSLGWEEDGDAEGGEGLTEEEISAFYREHMRSMSSSPLSSRIHNRLQNAVLRSSGGINGVSAGISSSDSESDGEVRAANNVLASRLVG
ncbi:hypothetical protein SELMODRAFT_446036 [Selaginella moellendorffii]|uniref:Uncharacterized protein n=1 Tax=Selaginella moellendorffii TaxID=88036 RepID=D8SN62_SELML|nr:uncharacterized protein LOC9645095 [Selaginella moellendorffii]EFJ14010.1 hypothetical protein SELMODRAFT_446036 [Selaginella moellendorffii]|eukprot:XP_002984760.1 uncharacterized protein LOC9645095 [Selaginella moellendorffii]